MAPPPCPPSLSSKVELKITTSLSSKNNAPPDRLPIEFSLKVLLDMLSFVLSEFIAPPKPVVPLLDSNVQLFTCKYFPFVPNAPLPPARFNLNEQLFKVRLIPSK